MPAASVSVRPSCSSVTSSPSSTSSTCPRVHQWSATYPRLYSTILTRMLPFSIVRHVAFPEEPSRSVDGTVLQSVVMNGTSSIRMCAPSRYHAALRTGPDPRDRAGEDALERLFDPGGLEAERAGSALVSHATVLID